MMTMRRNPLSLRSRHLTFRNSCHRLNCSPAFSTGVKKFQSRENSWINSSYIPLTFRPYLNLIRADKQIGTSLLLWPCMWSISLAAPLNHFPDIVIASKFAIGALLMRSAGCIINDMWDKDFDKHVSRTSTRPLASGELSMSQAGAALFLGLSAALGVLITLRHESILIGLASFPLVVAYPLMKRYTYFPQLFLGMTINWGAILGWTEVCGVDFIINTIPLYIGGIFWTLLYDTIYGYQDRKDDEKLGLKSTALFLGDRPHAPLALSATCMVVTITAGGYVSNLTEPFYAGMLLSASHLGWQILTLDISNETNIRRRFISNNFLGALITCAIVAGHF